MAGDRLDSWKDIASYLQRDVRTAIRWEKRGLPVHRVPGGQRQAVFAYKHEIDQWLRGEGYAGSLPGGTAADLHLAVRTGPASAQLSGGWDVSAVDSGLRAGSLENEATPPVGVAAQGGASTAVRARLIFQVGIGIVTLAAAVGLTARLLRTRVVARQIQLAMVQLTHDGAQKNGLVSDGAFLYFAEDRAGKHVLAKLPVVGGDIQDIQTPVINVFPLDVRKEVQHGGAEVLAQAYEANEEDHALWVLPTDGRTPRRVGSINAHSATWLADGKTIAFASGRGIFLTPDEGATIQLLSSFPTFPEELEPAPDGRRLRFLLRDRNWETDQPWEIVFGSGLDVASAAPIHINAEGCCENWAPIRGTENCYFVSFNFMPSSGRSVFRLISNQGSFLRPTATLTLKSDPLSSFFRSAFVAVPERNKMFLYGSSSMGGTEVFQCGAGCEKLQEFLPGVSANYVAFSPDGEWISYVTVGPEAQRELQYNLLWMSRRDGTQAHRLPTPGYSAELPRWSPDGRTIAFMAHQHGRPYRIYLVSTGGGLPREAAAGDDSQGAPTWSPDGKWLVYARIQCQPTKSCAVYRVEVLTGNVEMIPGSSGLVTARWSPDGRYIAALDPQRLRIQLYSVDRRTWRTLAGDYTGDDLNWSADSGYLYTLGRSAGKLAVIRHPVTGGAPDSVADLSRFTQLAPGGPLWFGMTPEGAILLSRGMGNSEIYSFDLPQE